jgi:hypothetical protein
VADEADVLATAGMMREGLLAIALKEVQVGAVLEFRANDFDKHDLAGDRHDEGLDAFLDLDLDINYLVERLALLAGMVGGIHGRENSCWGSESGLFFPDS